MKKHGFCSFIIALLLLSGCGFSRSETVKEEKEVVSETYEDVLVNRVHSLYKTQNLPDRCKTDDIFEKRYNQIRNFEEYLWENGTRIIKFFFCISKDEQKRRFMKRITA